MVFIFTHCLTCFHEHRPRLTTTKPIQPPIPPRCLLIGPRGSSKTTFLLRLKTSAFFPCEPTEECNVEELPVTPKTSLIFSDISTARTTRLHFLSTVPILDLTILFFLDSSLPLSTLPSSLSLLRSSLTYALSRVGIGYIGIVLNKQDLLSGPSGWHHRAHSTISGMRRSGEVSPCVVDEGERSRVVGEIRGEVEKVMEEVVGENVNWEILSGGKDGISAKTGVGVRDVFEVVARAVWGENVWVGGGVLGRVVTGGPTGLS